MSIVILILIDTGMNLYYYNKGKLGGESMHSVPGILLSPKDLTHTSVLCSLILCTIAAEVIMQPLNEKIVINKRSHFRQSLWTHTNLECLCSRVRLLFLSL